MSTEKKQAELIKEISGVNPLKCMKCGKCSASCPSFNEMDIKPHQFVSYVANENIEELVNSKSLWKCLSCFACVERCPRDVKPGKLIDAARQLVVRQKGQNYLTPDEIPVVADGDRVVDEPIVVDDKEWCMTCVSMGNPHAVVFVDDVAHFELEKYGPLFENHVRFPKRTNTEFVQIISRNEAIMRVWERGSAETWACGTGTCATVMACILNGLTDNDVLVHLRGGDLRIVYDEKSNHVFMTGPATEVFEGEIQL